MKLRKPRADRGPRRPPILVGAVLLAGLSLAWSAYAITDLMKAGEFGLSVALAGDIGWITVLWAEYRGLTITVRNREIPAAAVGWGIALGVAALLALHGLDARNWGQGIAGPFVVLIGKLVWAYALASLRDPAELTHEQLAEIHDVMRQSEYTARLHHAQLEQLDRAADAEIARIKAEARITLARDETDFEIALERIDKRAQIERRSPIALTAGHTWTGEAQHLEPVEPPARPTPEPRAQRGEPEPATQLSSQVIAPEPQAHQPEPFGFSAGLTPQSAQRAAAIDRVAELLAQDPGLTSGQVAEALSVSPATAKRYLREAKGPAR